VLREGNVIFLSSAKLELAEACSGISSLVSLLTVGIVYGYFTEDRTSRRVILAVSTLPIAIAANALRVAGTGVLAHFAGQAAADGFFHVFAGWLVFMSAVVMLFVLQALLRHVASDGDAVPMVGIAR
jgi:exosortase